VLRLRSQGAQLLDVRDAADFEGAHLAGSVNIALQGKYATWCGTLLSHDAPLVIIAEPGTEEEAVMRLGRIGFDNVAGYLNGGMESLRDRPELIRTIDRITAVAVSEQLASGQRPVVLDVRSENEWSAGHIDGSQNLPLNHLRERLGEIPGDKPVVVHCEGGYRSAIAASILAQSQRHDILDLVGGFKAWTASKLPVETAAVGA
jgi:rhodanese-related sulfurtransferase